MLAAFQRDDTLEYIVRQVLKGGGHGAGGRLSRALVRSHHLHYLEVRPSDLRDPYQRARGLEILEDAPQSISAAITTSHLALLIELSSSRTALENSPWPEHLSGEPSMVSGRADRARPGSHMTLRGPRRDEPAPKAMPPCVTVGPSSTPASSCPGRSLPHRS